MKINPNDWQERRYWRAYTEAYEEAIARTASREAPWVVVPANAKWYRNLVIAESIVEALRPHAAAWQARLEAIGRQARAALRRSSRS